MALMQQLRKAMGNPKTGMACNLYDKCTSISMELDKRYEEIWKLEAYELSHIEKEISKLESLRCSIGENMRRRLNEISSTFLYFTNRAEFERRVNEARELHRSECAEIDEKLRPYKAKLEDTQNKIKELRTEYANYLVEVGFLDEQVAIRDPSKAREIHCKIKEFLYVFREYHKISSI